MCKLATVELIHKECLLAGVYMVETIESYGLMLKDKRKILKGCIMIDFHGKRRKTKSWFKVKEKNSDMQIILSLCM